MTPRYCVVRCALADSCVGTDLCPCGQYLAMMAAAGERQRQRERMVVLMLY